MRVLHVTSSFPLTTAEPTGSFIADLVEAEQRAGHSPTVVAPHARGVDDASRGVPVHRFRYAPRRAEVLAYRGGLAGAARRPLGLLVTPLYIASMAAHAALWARRTRADVVHAHWWLPGGLAGLVAARLNGVPLVLTLHGSDVALARRWWAKPLARFVVRRAAVVTAVSMSLAREAEDVLALRHQSVVVTRMPVRRTPHAPPPPAPPPLRLVAAGRLSPEKGFDVLLDAVAALLADGISVELDLAGDGPERPRLEERAAPLGGRVRLHGFVARERLDAMIAGAHAMVVPSRREGLGLVAVEALAAGRPVVGSATGGLVETVRDGDGLLVPPGDVSALADALRRLPLPTPHASAVMNHDPNRVAAGASRVYATATVRRAQRWRPLRWLGAATAVAVVAVLVRLAVDDWPVIRHAWRHAGGGDLLVAALAMLAAEAGFGVASAGALRAATGRRVPLWRVASTFWVAQTAKNVPGGVWTAFARAGLARRLGLRPRMTLAWLGTEAAASCAAGAFVGAAAMAAGCAVGSGRFGPAAWAILAVAAAASPAVLSAGHWPARAFERVAGVAPAPAGVARAAGGYLPVWVAGGVSTAALARAVFHLDGAGMLVVGGAACVASVVGFLALPVPSGLGVRELVLVALAQPVLPTPVAVSVSLASRVLAVVAQLTLAAVALPSTRRPDDHTRRAAEQSL